MILQGVTVREMTKLFGISDRTWRNWMKSPEDLTLGRLTVIAKRLRTSVKELVDEE
jgi:transposase